MNNIKPSPFSLAHFQVDEFSIKRNPVETGHPEFSFEPSGLIDHVNESFLLTIEFEVKDSNDAFFIKCNCIGYFKFQIEEANKIEIDSFFYLNAPAIIFPYIRSFIASISALSGLAAINLPLLNFPKAVGEKLKANTQTRGLGIESKAVKKTSKKKDKN